MVSAQLEALQSAEDTYRLSLQIIAQVLKQVREGNYAPFKIRVRACETGNVKALCKQHAFKYKVVVTEDEPTFTITF